MKLTNSMREGIISRCLAAAFQQREEQYAKSRVDLAVALYDHAFPPDIQKRVAMLPRGWVNKSDTIRISCPGYEHPSNIVRYESHRDKADYHLRLPESRPIPAVMAGVFEYTEEHPMWERLQTVARMCANIYHGKQSLRHDLLTLLHSVSTLEKLRQVWPEGEPHFPKEFPAKPTGIVPIDLAAKVNKLMGLK